MRLPKKITPDRIRESIVQVFIQSRIPFDPLVGYLFRILEEMGFAYTNKPLKKPSNLVPGNPPKVLEFNFAPQHLFFNEQVKIQLTDGSLIFNCLEQYIGWSNYGEIIRKVLDQLHSQGVISSFGRVGVRYISEFPNTDIFNQINFQFNLSALKKPLKSGNFRMMWVDDPHRIILNLGTNLNIQPIVDKSGTKGEHLSLIDVDVIREFETNSPLASFTVIEEVHLKQKEIFFNILKEEFLNTLNPEY